MGTTHTHVISLIFYDETCVPHFLRASLWNSCEGVDVASCALPFCSWWAIVVVRMFVCLFGERVCLVGVLCLFGWSGEPNDMVQYFLLFDYLFADYYLFGSYIHSSLLLLKGTFWTHASDLANGECDSSLLVHFSCAFTDSSTAPIRVAFPSAPIVVNKYRGWENTGVR